MAIRWEKWSVDHWVAYSGKLSIGMVGARRNESGLFYYTLDAVHTKHVCKGRGAVKTMQQAKRSLARAWRQWCQEAGLK